MMRFDNNRMRTASVLVLVGGLIGVLVFVAMPIYRATTQPRELTLHIGMASVAVCLILFGTVGLWLKEGIARWVPDGQTDLARMTRRQWGCLLGLIAIVFAVPLALKSLLAALGYH